MEDLAADRIKWFLQNMRRMPPQIPPTRNPAAWQPIYNYVIPDLRNQYRTHQHIAQLGQQAINEGGEVNVADGQVLQDRGERGMADTNVAAEIIKRQAGI